MKFQQKLSFFLRSFFLQIGWNYEKYQHLGFLFVMFPFLKDLYKQDSEALPSVISRYLETFNTQPMMSSFCVGALAKEEESIQKTSSLNEMQKKVEEWQLIKQSLTSTTASIGDRLFWGVLTPLTLLVAIGIWFMLGDNFLLETLPQSATKWVVLPALFAVFIFNIVAMLVRWKGLELGYSAGVDGCFGLIKLDWNKLIFILKLIGLFLSVAFLAYGVYSTLHVFNLFDRNFITNSFLILFFVCMGFLVKKLRISNLYLYLVTIIVFNLLCYLK